MRMEDDPSLCSRDLEQTTAGPDMFHCFKNWYSHVPTTSHGILPTVIRTLTTSTANHGLVHYGSCLFTTGSQWKS